LFPRLLFQDYGTVVPAVARHDRDIGHLLGVQRADAESGHVRFVAEAKKQRQRKRSKSPLARFFGWFNRVFGRVTDSYVSASGMLVRRSAIAVVVLVIVSALALLLVGRLPGGFLPTEDQGTRL